MAFIKNLKIRGKLLLGFFLVLAITLFVAAFGATEMRAIDARYSYALEFPFERYSTLSDIEVVFMDARRMMNRAVMYISDPDGPIAGIDRQDAGLRAARAKLSGFLARYRASLEGDPILAAGRKAEMLDRLGLFEARLDWYFERYVAGVLAAARAFDEPEAIRMERLGAATIESALEHFNYLNSAARVYMESISSDLSVQTGRNFWALLAVALAAAILGVLVAFSISGMVSKPIGLLAAALSGLSSGDLTKRLPEIGRDETAMASRSFNTSIGEFRAMISAIKEKSDELSGIGSSLANNMAQTAAAMNQITANIQGIKGRVISQSASVTETNATMEQVTANISKLSGQVERQTGAVSQSSSALEQMIANIQSVASTLSRNAENVRALQDSSEAGRTSVREVAADIQEIARESEGLLEINAVMENIASQTNLLSMNAAIEAAHAGDAGRGFAVVADEIRKLAESSSEQSKTIVAVLKKIKSSIDKISRSIDSALGKFESIDRGVQTVAEQEELIRNAMEEQSRGSKQVLAAAGEVGEATRHVQAGSAEMLEGSREVILESKNLERVTQEITGGVNEMASGAEQVNKAVNAVSDLAGRTQENIAALAQAASRFTV